jgi:hypothetical protein
VKTIYSCLPPQTELLTFLNRAAKVPHSSIFALFLLWAAPHAFLSTYAQIKATNGAPQPKRLSKEENKKLRKLKNMRKRDGVRPFVPPTNPPSSSLFAHRGCGWLQGKETFLSTKRAMDGAVVGEGATPVGQETFGGRLLQSMGWTGGGLVGTLRTQ